MKADNRPSTVQVEIQINKSRGKEYRNLSQAPVKVKANLSPDNDTEISLRSGSLVNSKHDQPKIKTKQNKKYSNSPIKLDKGLKSIENRILQKMKNKRQNKAGNVLTKMPSIDRNHSPTISYGNELDSAKLTLSKVHDYNAKSSSKKHKHRNSDVESDIYQSKDLGSIRQTLSSAFQPNDADSFINKINYVKPGRDSQSEYDMYNSYGSSIGFTSDEKRMSNKMKYKIKAQFRYRDEVETAETDSFFSSKFSKFSPQGQSIAKPNKSIMGEMIKRQQAENGMPTNFPSITKNVPNKAAPFSLPSLK